MACSCGSELFLETNGEKMKAFSFVVASLFAASVAYGQTLPDKLTPAEQKIIWAEAGIKAHPDHSQPYNDLAVAYAQRVRETGDPSYYSQAETVLQKSFQITPDNLEGEKARLMILLGRGEYARSLELAKALNKKTPDDVLLYGFIADAAIELGEYGDAEQAAQWMLDLRPGNVPGLLRGAALRRFFGDTHGAMDFYKQAYQQMAPTQTEEIAWTLVEMADLQLSTGDIDGAEKLTHSALQQFPAYYIALEELARIEMAQQHYAAAVDLFGERNQKFPTAASRYAFAQALEHAGRETEAALAYADFLKAAVPLINSNDNANDELIFYYIERGHDPAEALRIAQIEIARRHDVNTLDAYAWALCSNERYEEAQKQMGKALAVGVRDASIFYHAGVIATKLKDDVTAARYLNESMQLNPTSENGLAAREALQKLSAKSAAVRGDD
jgi:tetratricopeptide (TPR) repeat protein